MTTATESPCQACGACCSYSSNWPRFTIEEDMPGRFTIEDAPASVQAGKEINSIPRQLGLTARYGFEGVANTAQIVTEPLRQFITDPLARAFGGKGGRPLGEAATLLADRLGLPAPEGANERVVGDATRLVAGAGGLGGAAMGGGAGSS